MRLSCAETAKPPWVWRAPELLNEREQLPQVVDTRHLPMGRMERLDSRKLLRNQEVGRGDPNPRRWLQEDSGVSLSPASAGMD